MLLNFTGRVNTKALNFAKYKKKILISYLDLFVLFLCIWIAVDVFLLGSVLLQSHCDLLWLRLFHWCCFRLIGWLLLRFLVIFIFNLFRLTGQLVFGGAPVSATCAFFLVKSLVLNFTPNCSFDLALFFVYISSVEKMPETKVTDLLRGAWVTRATVKLFTSRATVISTTTAAAWSVLAFWSLFDCAVLVLKKK